MFIIDLALKNTPSSLSVQRKTLEDAKAVYQQVLDAIRDGNPTVLEITCEQQPEKTIGILVSEISAVQMSEKSSTGAASGRPPGFFAIAQ
ncbi:hypothetical protein H6F67_14160 [Microcoleus sp. FACHB-1515]|uniref:hypothetical protein n=1 Tax=Cyanophyceae TaxID=3028117 RepID=UPI001689F4C2|nr:hypothetical protein [Microcoleus sp. FACHB-1515]MBD2090996.1 hypothetical protein [Microcoleus sp. FACHB-1515]